MNNQPSNQTKTAPDDFKARRTMMVRDQLEARGIRDPRVLSTMGVIPRERFVPSELLDETYTDHPVTLTEFATVSQPYIQALMTEALRLTGTEKILEIGTGSGYQTALLAELAGEVFSVELDQDLAESARLRLRELGYYNVHIMHGDGHLGWFDEAPFDAVIITGAPKQVPQDLFDQLDPHAGRLIAPLGTESQRLILHTRSGTKWAKRDLGAVRFVSLREE